MANRRNNVSEARELTAGLIGEHISRTRLPAALEILCAEYGYDLSFELIDSANRTPFDFRATVNELRNWGWSGVSVTHPFKISAASYAADAMETAAAHLGAANALIFEEDDVRGHNTDYTGFLSAWRANMGDETPGRVAMAGAGGVAAALAPALLQLGAEEIALWDIDPAKATALKTKLNSKIRVVTANEAIAATHEADGLVNASVLGMAEYPGMAFATNAIGKQKWAFDAVYTPPETLFLATARQAGLRPISGFELFKHMALRTFAAYTGVMPDQRTMLPCLDALRPE